MLEDNILQIRNWDRISNSVVLHTSSSNYSEKCLLFRLAAYVHLNGAFLCFIILNFTGYPLIYFWSSLLRILIFSDIFSLLFCQCSDYSVLLPLKKNQAVHSEDRISFKKVKFRSPK